MTFASPIDMPAPGAVFPPAARPLGFPEVLEWWRIVWGARPFRKAVVRLGETSPHLLSDIGMAGHELVRRQDAETERAARRIRIAFAGCW